MAVEIERKFLVKGDFPREGGVKMVQAYLSDEDNVTVRVRTEDLRAVITVKGAQTGITRLEYEYEIPLEDAKELMKLAAGSLVEKTRYYHRRGDHTWEIDVFEGENQGLVVAEIELMGEAENFDRPEWIDLDVSHDPRYANSSLSREPFTKWIL
ncbi:MAG: CYTH domain-containing protein [Akkermansiaceae bacterium]